MKDRVKATLALIQGAREAGAKAAEEKLAALQAAGPAWKVVENAPGDVFHDPARPTRTVGTLLDVCGFANLRIAARGWFYLTAKRLTQQGTDNYRFVAGTSYHGGGRLAIFDMTFRQELSVNEAANQAAADYLKAHGIEATVESRID